MVMLGRIQGMLVTMLQNNKFNTLDAINLQIRSPRDVFFLRTCKMCSNRAVPAVPRHKAQTKTRPDQTWSDQDQVWGHTYNTYYLSHHNIKICFGLYFSRTEIYILLSEPGKKNFPFALWLERFGGSPGVASVHGRRWPFTIRWLYACLQPY